MQKNLIRFLFAVTALLNITIGFTLPAYTQSNQTLGDCTKDLIEQYYDRDKALKTCAGTLQYQKTSQTLGQCTNGLIGQYYDRDTAANACTELLQKQQQYTENDNPRRRESYRDSPSGDPQAIADCMKKLLYENRPVCTREGSCARLSSPAENANQGFGGWQWQTVRTEISEDGAARACRNAR
jgi:hypothetical protein